VLFVKISVKGQLDESWSEWFEDLTIEYHEGKGTILSGNVIDQAALYSLITRLSRLGLILKSVEVSPDNNHDDPKT